MEKKTPYRYILILVLLLALLFFSTLFVEGAQNLFLIIIILWALFLPIFSNFHYSFIYVISLPAPIFGSWFLLNSLVIKYVEYSGYWGLAMAVLSTLLVYAFHIGTRSETMFWKATKSGLTRSSIGAASALFIFFGTFVLNPSLIPLDVSNEIFYFSVALLAYIISSTLNVNY